MQVTRTIAAAIATISLLLVACNGQGSRAAELASDQTLRLVINAEPRPGTPDNLDPAYVDVNRVGRMIGDNVFDGLYRFDGEMQERPDIAMGLPQISTDGLTYTFRLRHDVRFWNGTLVTSADFVYSWKRAARLNGDWAATVLGPVAGFPDLTGLSAPDAYTLVAHLTTPTGFWLTLLALPAAWVVSKAAIDAGGQDLWWSNPDTLVGTGPFRLTTWRHNAELDFAAVPEWWGGSTGALKRIELHVEPDRAARWNGYEQGRYDVLGYGNPEFGASEASPIAALRADANRRAEIRSYLHGATNWVAFNLQAGPFSGEGDGALLRRAFSQSIDRDKLAAAACAGGTVCVPATGGLITKGLKGYLGDGADPGSKFDAASARATVKRLDPNGTLLRGLVFYYPTPAIDLTQATAENLHQQWLSNLGVDVAIRGWDKSSFFTTMTKGHFLLWRYGWAADYDHPEDWFDNLYVSNPGCLQLPCNTNGAVYDRPQYNELIKSADQVPIDKSLPQYLQAGRMLVDDYAFAVLYYIVETSVVKPYVDGFRTNGLTEARWTAIRILRH
jgi:oligopeptide transport system substrate-binding protein